MVCAACVDTLRAWPGEAACSFCDHPRAGVARAKDRPDVAICGDCLAFARQALRDDGGKGKPTDEVRLDPDQLWNDLTPAPRPVVDPDAPASAHADLAVAFFEMGLIDDARDQVAKALALDPRHAVALRLLEKLPPPSRRPSKRP